MKFKKTLVATLLATSAFHAFASAPAITETAPAKPTVPCKMFTLVDQSTNKTLASDNENETTQIASLTKIMTAYITFNEVKNHLINLDDKVLISKNAWRTGGSRMFLNVGDTVTVDELLRGMLSVSGNDAATALAEHIAGSTQHFADIMNQYAKSLGMTNTVYGNPTGLPLSAAQKAAGVQEHSTSHDLAILAEHVYSDFPEFAHYFNIKSFTYNNITQPNRNKLLFKDSGYEGMKTGFTDRAGYGVVTAFEKDGRRIIAVCLHAKSVPDRFAAADSLTMWGMNNYKLINPVDATKSITSLPVYGGTVDSIKVYPEKSLKFVIPRSITSNDNVSIVVALDKNGENTPAIFAPVAKNLVVGELTVMRNGEELGSTKLITKDAVQDGGFVKRLTDKMKISVHKMFG